MKKFLTVFFAPVLLVFALGSCTKKENKIYLQGGTPPVLTASANSIALSSKTANDVAITFSWTNPAYTFTTGINSQNVTYSLQIDTTGANFTNPLMQQISVSNDLSHSVTVGDLNNYLASFTKLALVTDLQHNVEIRVVATLNNGAAPLPSNVLKFTVVPYETFALDPPVSGELYITGTAVPTGYTNTPPESQKCNKISKGEFKITFNMQPGKEYKFLSNQAQWQPQYGSTSGGTAFSGGIGVNLGNSSDPPAIFTPSVAGTYTVDLNFKTGKYTVTQ
jgi:starch-binding outer membrane protein SusE/F